MPKMVMTSFGNRNFMQPMGRLNMHSKCFDFIFLLSFGWGKGKGDFFFSFYLFPTCSFQVPIRFPMCSLRVFPITSRFNPICFAQSPPLLTYIGGPKREALHLSIESSILGASIVSTFFCNGPIKLAHCKKTKSGFVKHPQLINMK
jgi:hypothetical protein